MAPGTCCHPRRAIQSSRLLKCTRNSSVGRFPAFGGMVSFQQAIRSSTASPAPRSLRPLTSRQALSGPQATINETNKKMIPTRLRLCGRSRKSRSSHSDQRKSVWVRSFSHTGHNSHSLQTRSSAPIFRLSRSSRRIETCRTGTLRPYSPSKKSSSTRCKANVSSV